MNISNLLWNDTKDAIIALAKQIKDDTVSWQDYHYTGDDGQIVYPFNSKTEADKFQGKLNEIFLTHYTDYQTFLHTKGIDGVIDTWKDVEDFLKNITDDEAMSLMRLIGDLQEASGNLNIRMSEQQPGIMEAVTRTETPVITSSNLDEAGNINIVYTYE